MQPEHRLDAISSKPSGGCCWFQTALDDDLATLLEEGMELQTDELLGAAKKLGLS